MDNLTRKQLKNQAERIAIESGFNELPIDPRVIAEKHDIPVIAKPESEAGCSGMLIQSGNRFLIAYATHISSIGFQNFSIAHELGHYFIPGHPQSVIRNGLHVSQAELGRDKYEKEADIFASALLMPEELFKKEIPISGEGLDAIKRIADKAKTSLTATASRYAELSEEAIASFLSEGNKILAYTYSDKIRGIARETLPHLTGKKVPQKSLTASFFADPAKISNAFCETTEIDAGDWFGVGHGTICGESVLGLGTYNRVLTIIRCTIRTDDDVDFFDSAEDEAELIQQWTPRFKR